MLETFVREEKQAEALEKIQNTIRNTKVGITAYLNDYVKGEYDAITTIGSTGQLLKMAGQKVEVPSPAQNSEVK